MAATALDRTPSQVVAASESDLDPLLGGYSALAEAAWMAFPQATEVLEPLPVRERTPLRNVRLPPLRNFLTRELTIPEASFVLMAAFFLSAALGAVRQVLFNAQFGTSADANAYYAAFRLPDTLFSLIAGGALSSALIPVLLTTAREDGRGAALHLVNIVLTTLLAVFAVITLLGVLFAPFFVQSVLAPGFDQPTSALATQLTRVMLIQPLILAAGSVATAVLNSRNRFVFGALSLLTHNLTLIAGILAAKAVPGLSIWGPTLGVVLGAVMQVLILLPGLFLDGARPRPAWDLANTRLREVFALLAPNGLAVGVGYAGFILDTSFASRADDSSALAAILNAWLLVGLPIALLGQAVGQAAFPRLAAHAAANQWTEMRRTLLRSVATVALFAIPCMLGLTLLGRNTIRVLFEHGKFDAAAGALTYDVLVVYALALPFYVATEVISRGLIALRDTRSPLITNTLQLAGRAACIAVFLDRWGTVAIPAAFAITASIETVALAGVLAFSLRSRQRRT